MKPLIRVTLLCFVILGLLIGGSVLVGQAQARPEFFRYLGSCAGAPCYVGIVPGQTRWTEIEARFEIVTDLRGDNLMYLAYAPPGFAGTLRFYPTGNGSIREVDLRFHTTWLKLGDIVAEMGTPCAVEMTSRFSMLVYPGVKVLATWETLGATRNLQPTSTVLGINLIEAQSCLTSSPALHRWQGFRRYVS
jgi:hypothetical protein